MVEFVACFRTLDQESRWVHSIEQGSRHTRAPVYRLWNGTDFGGSTGKKLPGSWKQLDLACERRYLCGAAPCSVQTAHENLPFRCPPPPRSASQCAYICSHLLPQFHQVLLDHCSRYPFMTSFESDFAWCITGSDQTCVEGVAFWFFWFFGLFCVIVIVCVELQCRFDTICSIPSIFRWFGKTLGSQWPFLLAATPCQWLSVWWRSSLQCLYNQMDKWHRKWLLRTPLRWPPARPCMLRLMHPLMLPSTVPKARPCLLHRRPPWLLQVRSLFFSPSGLLNPFLLVELFWLLFCLCLSFDPKLPSVLDLDLSISDLSVWFCSTSSGV